MMVTPIDNQTDIPEIHRAGCVVIDADNYILNGYLKIVKGEIVDVGKWVNKPDAAVVDHGEGLLCPSLINAHTHLELSALEGVLPFGDGFKKWVQALLHHRDNISETDLAKGVAGGVDALIASGCFVVGEIATLGLFEEMVRESSLEGVYFKEYLGGMDNIPDELPVGDGLTKSYAGHAPHTTSPELLKYLKRLCLKKNLPFSVHLSESEDEEIFMKTGEGEWADFLKQRGIDYSSWPITESGSVSYLDTLGLLDDKTIAVHLNRADRSDFALLEKKNVNVCLCPRSNINLHDKLPDAVGMHNKGINLCLGTDSLASNQSLSIIDEMCFMSSAYPEIPPSEIFRMATQNGAKALGLSERFGSLEKGKAGKCFYLHVSEENNSDVYSGLMKTQ